MAFVGMDHGTTGVSFTVLSGDNVRHFKIGREDLSSGRVSALEELGKRVPLNDIELMVITYAMGDAINKIKPIDKVKNRGIISIGGAGKVTGGGTAVYSEIEASGIPTLLVPGLHRGTPCLDKRFRAAYSHHASPEKVSICYNAYLETGWENMIVSDISSNTVTMLIQNGRITGAMDACIGAMGVIHGPLDLEMLRKIDDGEKTANECFSNAGAVKIAGIETRVSRARDELIARYLEGDQKAELALETMIMTIAMEIWGLAGIAERVDGIVLTGSMGSMEEPFNFYGKLKDFIGSIGSVRKLGATSGSMGSAQMARDISAGAREILGIEVDF